VPEAITANRESVSNVPAAKLNSVRFWGLIQNSVIKYFQILELIKQIHRGNGIDNIMPSRILTDPVVGFHCLCLTAAIKSIAIEKRSNPSLAIQ
jgi:hypothetical protein